jgi:hypothetical protein
MHKLTMMSSVNVREFNTTCGHLRSGCIVDEVSPGCLCALLGVRVVGSYDCTTDVCLMCGYLRARAGTGVSRPDFSCAASASHNFI